MFDIGLTPLEKYVAIAHITNITGPSMTKDTIDTTALDTVGGYRTFITGFKNAGTLTLTVMFEATGYKALKDFMIVNPLNSLGSHYQTRLHQMGMVLN